MPLLVNKNSEHTFSGTNSSWSNMTGTNTYSFFSTINDATASQAVSYSTSGGYGTWQSTPPAYGQTIFNFQTDTSTGAKTFSFTPEVGFSTSTASNRLMLIAVENNIGSGTADEPASVSGLGVTWTKVTTRTFGIRRISLYRACASTVTSAPFTFSMTNAMTRVYVWGYDFINVDTTAGGAIAVPAFIDNNTASSTTVTGTVTASTVKSARYVFFGARGTGVANPTTVTSTDIAWASFPSTDKHWVASPLNSNTVGDYLSSDNAGKFGYSASGANALIGVSLIPVSTASSNIKTYICSSGSTPATLANGSIKIVTVLGNHTTATVGNNPSIFCWSPTSTAVDTNKTCYTAGFGYQRSKGPDNAIGTTDDTGAINLQIVQYAAGSSVTIASTTINESTYRSSGELWTLELVIAKETSTQSRLILYWDIPPLSGGSKVTGSLSTGLINTPASDLAFGFLHNAFNSTSVADSFSIDYLSVTDYAQVPKQALIQAVNRSAVW